MTLTVAELDALPAQAAAEELAACCGSSRWVMGMLMRRPFGTRDQVLEAADDAAEQLDVADWIEAFSHHPKIGESRPSADVGTTARDWSANEQSTAAASLYAIQEELAEANRMYAEHFGFIFIICASGRTAPEILAALRDRMNNQPEVELAIAAHEQHKITRLRLDKLLSS